MSSSRWQTIVLLMVIMVGGWMMPIAAHQDPCHRFHSCPSDHGTYVCGDKGRCDQCPDNYYGLARKLRPAASSNPAQAPSSSIPVNATSTPAVTVCFTPGGR